MRTIAAPLLASWILALAPGAPPAAAQAAPAAAPAVAARPAVTPAAPDLAPRLAAALDAVTAETMAAAHIPGAVVVLVADGRVVASKGYGLADVERKTPVSPDGTVFRVASLAKPVVSVAVLQLADQGRLDLRSDVNRYLKSFRLQETFAEPVRVADLLTHTGGFDELYIGTAGRTAVEQMPLGSYLAAHMPPRMLPPGRVFSYSNHGMALAAYLVETAAGIPYERYVQEHVFAPLGMAHSGYRADGALRDGLAVGYAYADGGFRPVPYDYLNTAPAAGLLTTGNDMARFLIAQLQGGALDGARVLSRERMEQMLRRQFSHHPDLPGRTYAYSEEIVNGHRVLEHEGDVRGFASAVYLVPEQGLGLFVAYNSAVPELRDKLIARLAAELPPAPLAPAAARTALARAATDSGRAAGWYRFVRYPRSTVDKLAVLIGLAPEIRLSRSDNGSLVLDGQTLLAEVRPKLFQNRDSIDLTSGRGVAVVGDDFRFAAFSDAAYERIAWWESAMVQTFLILALLLIFLSACLVLPLRARRERRKTESAAGSAPRRRAFGRVAGLMCALNALLLVGLVAVLAGTEPYEFTYGVPGSIELLLLIPPVTSLLALALPFLAVRGWGEGVRARRRIFDSLIVVAGLALIPVLLYWNLLGYYF